MKVQSEINIRGPLVDHPTPLSDPTWPGDWALEEIPTDLKSSEHGKNFETTPRVLARSPGASRSRFISSSFFGSDM